MLGMSPLFKKRPSFKNAIVQNIAGGNTMVFNNNLKLILEKIAAVVKLLIYMNDHL